MNVPIPKQYVCDLAPYQPGTSTAHVARKHGLKRTEITKLASNENPLGPSPASLAAAAEALESAHRYPEQYALHRALAAKWRVATGQVVVGNGSNDVLDMIARAFLGAGDEAICSQYAFAVYAIATQSVGAATVAVAAKDYGHDIEAMLAAITPRTKVIWIANPNNPTGTFVPYDELKAALAKIPRRILIVMDEAYYEYLEAMDRHDTTRWLANLPNLILVRTFSKIYGLAGLRIGYGLTSSAIVETLNRIRQPFNANSVAIAAATAALGDDSFVRQSRALNQAGRAQLVRALEAMDLKVLPAYGNFVTVAIPQAGEVYKRLEQEGIIVRPLGTYGMPDHLRVTIGTRTENERCIAALMRIKQVDYSTRTSRRVARKH